MATLIPVRNAAGGLKLGTAIIGLLVSAVSGAGTALAVVRAEAEIVVTKAWSERQRVEVVSIASEAARVGASQAISEQFRNEIAPLMSEMKAHERMDDQRHVDLVERVSRLESRVDRVEGRGPVIAR